jgi:hypothetical protein
MIGIVFTSIFIVGIKLLVDSRYFNLFEINTRKKNPLSVSNENELTFVVQLDS